MAVIPFLFDYIPIQLVSLIGPVVLIVVGFLIENNFVSRPAIFMNAIAVNLAFVGKDIGLLGIYEIPLLLYLNIGLVVGVIAILSRATRFSLPSLFYTMAWAYSSIAAGIILVLSLGVSHPILLYESSVLPSLPS